MSQIPSKAVIRSMVRISNPSQSTKDMVSKLLRYTNPAYVRVVRFGNKFGPKPPKFIYGFMEKDNDIWVPRQWYLSNLHQTGEYEATVETVDNYWEHNAPLIDPLEHQLVALTNLVDAVDANDNLGLPTDTLVVIPPGEGKTILGMFAIYACKQKTLVVVPTKEIEAAWIKDSKKVFGDIKLGTIRGKHIDTDKGITIGSIQTLMKLDPKEWADRFGMVIIDETHRIGAEVFSNVIKRCRSGIRVGLTATDYRKDGRFVSVKWHLGEACYKSEVRTNTVPLTYCTVKTPYGLLKALDDYTFNDLLASLQRNTDRTLTIVLLCEYIIRNYDGDILLVSPRTEHLESIAAALADRHVSVCVITGKTPDRAKLYEDVLNGKYKITVATTSIMSEGASNPRWHHVISTMPFSDMKTAIQLTGRAIRKANGKSKGFFWDIVDANPMAKHMYKSRWNALKKIVKEVLIFNSNATSTTQETRS